MFYADIFNGGFKHMTVQDNVIKTKPGLLESGKQLGKNQKRSIPVTRFWKYMEYSLTNLILSKENSKSIDFTMSDLGNDVGNFPD